MMMMITRKKERPWVGEGAYFDKCEIGRGSSYLVLVAVERADVLEADDEADLGTLVQRTVPVSVVARAAHRIHSLLHSSFKLAFHDADTDTDILADILVSLSLPPE